MKFETENPEVIDGLSDSQSQNSPDGSPDRQLIDDYGELKRGKHKKSNSAKLQHLFLSFGQNHIKMLVRAAEEADKEDRERAKNRQKPSYVLIKPKNLIKGREPIHFLLEMVQDADYYELHRKLFKEALLKAQEDINQRPIERERTLSLERAKNEAEARALVAKHKAKVAKIKIERPYLQSQEINDIVL